MKKNLFFLTIPFLMLILIVACTKDIEDNPEDDPIENPEEPTVQTMRFVTSYVPKADNNVLGDAKLTALLTVGEDGTVEYSKLSDYYDASGGFLWREGDVSSSGVAMKLHNDFINLDGNDTGYNGIYLGFDDETEQVLPLLLPEDRDKYIAFISGVPKISDNGYVFYLSATENRNYGDQYKPTLVRYNPETQVLDQAPNPKEFALNQPEKGDDTEAAQIRRDFYPSPDGRYVYGIIEAYGVDFGSLHWDYEILFKYDFETSQYTRLNPEGSEHPSFIGVTDDGNYLAYGMYSGYKFLNLNSGELTDFDETPSYPYPVQWNNNGFCTSTTVAIRYYDFLNNKSYAVIEKHDNAYAQFDKSGDRIVFMLEGDENNFLCRTKDLNENTTYDTIAKIPTSFVYPVLIK